MASIIIFIIFSFFLVGVGLYASRQSKTNESYFLANRSLGWLLVGISASVTGNTGFIVTGAVGIGYSMGLSSLLLPLSWLLGDLLYWNVFPKKLNLISKEQNSSTISEYLSYNLPKNKTLIYILIGIIVFGWFQLNKINSKVEELTNLNSDCEYTLEEANNNIEEANSIIEDAQSYAWSSYEEMGDALDNLYTVDTVSF